MGVVRRETKGARGAKPPNAIDTPKHEWSSLQNMTPIHSLYRPIVFFCIGGIVVSQVGPKQWWTKYLKAPKSQIGNLEHNTAHLILKLPSAWGGYSPSPKTSIIGPHPWSSSVRAVISFTQPIFKIKPQKHCSQWTRETKDFITKFSIFYPNLALKCASSCCFQLYCFEFG